MSQRGAALAVVLALVSAVLTIGLAMGALSTFSLRMTTRLLDNERSELAARGAVAQLMALLRQHQDEVEFHPLRPDLAPVSERLPETLVFQDGAYRASVHFETSRSGFSTDNLAGESPALGWPDQDSVPRVAPFTLGLVVEVDGPSGRQRFRAGLTRTWPYALYARRGPILLMALPGGAGRRHAPSLVEGDVYTTWEGLQAGGGTLRQGYGFGRLNDPSKVLANLEARQGFQPERPPDHHLLVGCPLGFNPPRSPSLVHSESDSERLFYHYNLAALARHLHDVEDSPNFSPEQRVGVDSGNRLQGDFVYDHSLDAEIPPVVQVGSEHRGRTRLHRGLALDPLEQIQEATPGPGSSLPHASYQPLLLPRPDYELAEIFELPAGDLEVDDGDGEREPPFLLAEDLILTESENSTGGPLSTHYVVEGSVSNRQVVYHRQGPGAGVYIRENRAGLKMQGTVLHVRGDLDLSSRTDLEGGGSSGSREIEIYGAGATLIVDGQLILGNATVSAQDQGFVLYARDIVLKGGGHFCGLMIAENSITILSQDRELTIQGALLCAGLGGITLKGTRIEHDPDYLKSLHGAGDLELSSWYKL